jgi:hypothetical protein
VGFVAVCTLYALLTLAGYILLGEAQWVRDLKASRYWTPSLSSLERWIKRGESSDAERRQSLVTVTKIRGKDALLVRDFSSLVFRSAHQGESLHGRNVFLTKDEVEAQLWLPQYDTWLEMEPNTLIVLDETQDAAGGPAILNINVLAGGWKLRETSPKSKSLRVRDFVAQKKSLRAKETSASRAPVLLSPDTAIEEGTTTNPTLGSQLQSLAKALEVEPEAKPQVQALEIVEPEAPRKPASVEAPVIALKPKSRKKPNIESMLWAETTYISSMMRLRGDKRAPAALALGLSVALEQASSGSRSDIFNPAQSQILKEYLEIYLKQGECERVKDLFENVATSYEHGPVLEDWQNYVIERNQKSKCPELKKSSPSPEVR